MLTNFAEKKQTFFDYLKKTSNNRTFSKRLAQCFWSKNAIFFFIFFSIKIRIKIRFINDLDSKQTFCYYKEKLFHSPINRIFPRGLTHVFSQKYHLFLYLFSVKIRLEIMLNKV